MIEVVLEAQNYVDDKMTIDVVGKFEIINVNTWSISIKTHHHMSFYKILSRPIIFHN